MPNFVSYPLDRHLGRTGSVREGDEPPILPRSWFETIFRGARNVCPRCGRNPLFGRFLKPVPVCVNCGQDWSLQSADDFPAYLSILVTGHLVVPLIITLTSEFDLSAAMLAAIIVPLTALLIVALLQPAKGAVIATQWWLGMNGFKLERREAGESGEALPADPATPEFPFGPRRRTPLESGANGPLGSPVDDAPGDALRTGPQVPLPAVKPPCKAKHHGDIHDHIQ